MKTGQWIGIIAFVASLYILWKIRQLLLLLFTAIVLANALNHMVQRFQRSRIKRSIAILLSVSLVGLLLLIVLLLVVPPFLEQFEDLLLLLPLGLEQIQVALNWLEQRVNLPNLPDATLFIRQLQPLGMNLVQQAFLILTTSINVFAETLLVLIVALMLLVNPRPYRQTLIRFFPAFYRSRVDEILTLCDEGLGSWTTGALIEMVFIGAMSAIGLWILQVPLVLAHAVLAGILNFIPNIGPTLSAVLPMTVGFLDAPWKAIAVLILYIVIQNVESYWLTPTIMAKQVSLLPAATLAAQIFFTTFFGPLGLVMALPLSVVVKTWIEEVLFKDILDQWKQPASNENKSC